MNKGAITGRQLKRLQTLWGVFWKHVAKGQEGAVGQVPVRLTERSARLAWVGGVLERHLASFKDLTGEEAAKAVDALQKHLPAELVQRRKRPSRREARELGMAGRRGYSSRVAQPPDRQQLSRIQNLLGELGWDQARLEAWLRSRHGPMRGRAQIRTKGDANAVAWGLKHLLKQRVEVPA